MNAPEPQTKAQTDGPIEVRPIRFIGGPLQGKTVADTGQATLQTARGDVYKRIHLDIARGDVELGIDILAYYGLVQDQE